MDARSRGEEAVMAEETRTAGDQTFVPLPDTPSQSQSQSPASQGPLPPWTPKMDELLQDWRNRVYAAQSAYYETAEKLHRQNYWLGIPVIVVSSVVGTAIFADWSKDGTLKWIVGSVSIAAAILASLQTFLKFGENATLHGNAADWFAAIRRDIDQLLALPAELRGHPKHTLDNLRQEINKAGQKSPELSERLWRRTARRFGVNEPPPSSGRAPAPRQGAAGKAAPAAEQADAGFRPRVRRKAS
jgi:hypothetical protein